MTNFKQKPFSFFWSALQGAGIAILIALPFAAITWYAYEPSLAQICAKTNERGSSPWVACVDRMILERKQ